MENDSCVVLQAFRDWTVHTKLEYIESVLYEVTARYMELDDETQSDGTGREEDGRGII